MSVATVVHTQCPLDTLGKFVKLRTTFSAANALACSSAIRCRGQVEATFGCPPILYCIFQALVFEPYFGLYHVIRRSTLLISLVLERKRSLFHLAALGSELGLSCTYCLYPVSGRSMPYQGTLSMQPLHLPRSSRCLLFSLHPPPLALSFSPSLSL